MTVSVLYSRCVPTQDAPAAITEKAPLSIAVRTAFSTAANDGPKRETYLHSSIIVYRRRGTGLLPTSSFDASLSKELVSSTEWLSIPSITVSSYSMAALGSLITMGGGGGAGGWTIPCLDLPISAWSSCRERRSRSKRVAAHVQLTLKVDVVDGCHGQVFKFKDCEDEAISTVQNVQV